MSRSHLFEELVAGEAFVDLRSWLKIAVSGSEASSWLGDLVSADLSDIGRGAARRSLLLSPTGRVRAEFTVTVYREALLLLQDPAQPHRIDELLNRYVLSSDVTLEDRTDDLALFAFPGRSEQPEVSGAEFSIPSCLGGGIDVLLPSDRHDDVSATLASSFQRAGMEDVEAWRVFRGIPRFGVDATEDDLPQEGGLENAVSFEKGCYVGQEAVAKVRNLGHPRRVLLHVEASGTVTAGEPVCADGTEIGKMTSAAETPRGIHGLAKVRWDARNERLVTSSGIDLVPVA